MTPSLAVGERRPDARAITGAELASVHVIPLGPGAHTIQACYRTAAAGRFVSLRVRTLIAESQTK